MFQFISTGQVAARLETEALTLVDIRDAASRAAGHIPGSVHLTQTSLEDFLRTADRERPVVVYCYHGNSSQQAAAYLQRQGFAQVYSMNGGFTEWRERYPERTSVAEDGAAAA